MHGDVGAALGEAQDAIGSDAKQQRGDGREGDGDGGRYGYWGIWSCRRIVVSRTCVKRCEQAQVVEAGDSTVEQADKSEPYVAGMKCRGEDVELAEESAGERNSDEREQEETEHCCENRSREGEAGVVVYRAEVLVVAGDLGDDGERADIHRSVCRRVEAG